MLCFASTGNPPYGVIHTGQSVPAFAEKVTYRLITRGSRLQLSAHLFRPLLPNQVSKQCGHREQNEDYAHAFPRHRDRAHARSFIPRSGCPRPRFAQRKNRHRSHHRISHHPEGHGPPPLRHAQAPTAAPAASSSRSSPAPITSASSSPRTTPTSPSSASANPPPTSSSPTSLNAKQAGGTFFTETVEINGAGFEADNLTFENTAGNTGQAVAVADRADRAIFKHCRFLGHQDTLFADYGRQYYVDSYIEGGVDFIFGNAAAVFDRDEIHSNGPGYLTAQSRTSPDQPTGYVILNSKVTSGIQDVPRPRPAPASTSPPQHTISLGRPWRPYSRVIYIHTELPADIVPQGWNAWGNTPGQPQAYYAEYQCTGPGRQPQSPRPLVAPAHRRPGPPVHPRIFLAGPDHWNPEAEARNLP